MPSSACGESSAIYTLSLHDALPISAGEVAGDQVAHQRLADGVLAAAGADDRDRARVEEPVDRGGLGAVLAVEHQPDRRVGGVDGELDRKSTRLNSSHVEISYAVFCLWRVLCDLHSFPTRRSSDLGR